MAKQRAPMVRLPAIELVAPLALLGLVLSAPAGAEVTIRPAIAVRETYTDNANLSAGDNTHGEFITDVSPSLAMAISGPRLKLNANVNAHLYANSGGDGNTSNYLQLASSGTADVVDELFYVDGSASRSRQSVSAFGQQFQQGYNDVNSDIITTYRISPYLVHNFGQTASAQLRYTRDSVKSSRNLLGNSNGNAVLFNLNSGPKFTTVGWGLNANHQQIDDPLAGKYDADTALLNLRYRLKNTLSVYTNLGYDKYTYEGLGGTTKGKNYALGFTWTPSQRTNIDASIGRRYFGKTYSLAARLRSRNTIWIASYRDDITTTRAQFLQPGSIDTATLLDSSFATAFPDPIQRRQAIEAYIHALGLPATVANNINYFSNRLMLQKEGQASVVVNGSRSMAIASISTSKRTALSPAGVDQGLAQPVGINLNDDTQQRSGSLALNYRLSPRSSATFNTSRSYVRSLNTGLETEQTLFTFVLSKQFERRLSGTVELRHNSGETLEVSGSHYRENAITASLSYQL